MAMTEHMTAHADEEEAKSVTIGQDHPTRDEDEDIVIGTAPAAQNGHQAAVVETSTEEPGHSHAGTEDVDADAV
jgi:hypothetical protein